MLIPGCFAREDTLKTSRSYSFKNMDSPALFFTMRHNTGVLITFIDIIVN